MNDDRSNPPKPLPDDFGMTLPGYRLPKQNQPEDFDKTTPSIPRPQPPLPQQNQPYRQQPPPLPPDDFGMTMQNIPRPQQPPPPRGNQPNYNQPPAAPPASEDFGMTMPNVPRPGSGGGNQPSSGSPYPPSSYGNQPPSPYGSSGYGNQAPYNNPPQSYGNQSPYHNSPGYGSQSPYNQPPDDFGMTTPNLRLPNGYSPPQPPRQSVDDFDLTMQNQRSVPSDLNFDSTMPGSGGARHSSGNDPDFGATQMYINLPQQKIRPFEPDPATLAAQQQQQKQEKRGLPLWTWLVIGGSSAVVFLAVASVLVFAFWFGSTGFDLVVKGAPPRSDVYIDNSLVGVTSADGSTKVFGLKASGKRNLKVTREGFSDFNDTVLGENGATREVIAQMKPLAITTQQTKPCEACKDIDPRICKAECEASDALDRLTPPFTVDDLVKALNLQIINFETNKFDVPPAREAFLRKASEKFKQLQGKPVVEIGGHTDNVGQDAPNLELSQNRAMAVRTLLTAFGVDSAMLQMKGYGKSQPKTTNETEEGKFQNRRIEYKVISR